MIDGITETVKREINKKESRFIAALLASLAASVVKPVICLMVKGITRRGNRRAGKRYMDKIILVPLHHLSNIRITKYYEFRLNSVFS